MIKLPACTYLPFASNTKRGPPLSPLKIKGMKLNWTKIYIIERCLVYKLDIFRSLYIKQCDNINILKIYFYNIIFIIQDRSIYIYKCTTYLDIIHL